MLILNSSSLHFLMNYFADKFERLIWCFSYRLNRSCDLVAEELAAAQEPKAKNCVAADEPPMHDHGVAVRCIAAPRLQPCPRQVCQDVDVEPKIFRQQGLFSGVDIVLF